MRTIPEQITDAETLSHALFIPGDAKKEPFWVKQSALVPPNRNPNEVSFNRACYIPDNEQRKIAKAVKRKGKVFSGFVILNVTNLKKALNLFKMKNSNNAEALNFAVSFTYTPLFSSENAIEWPKNIEKRWGSGYNPAHTDLYFATPVKRGEHNASHLGLAAIICNKENALCQVYEDNIGSEYWDGPDLCASY